MSVKQSVLKFAGRTSRDGVYVAPNIPPKKLKAAKSQYLFSDDEAIVLYDDTVFGSAKDGIAITEEYLYAKQLWESPKSIKLSEIQSISSESKLLNNLDIIINSSHFTTISSADKGIQPFILGILKAAKEAAVAPKSKLGQVEKAKKSRSASSTTRGKSVKQDQKVSCSECSAELPKSAKFCLECGAKVMPKGMCLECGTKIPKKAKFCPECGASAGNAEFKPAQETVEVSLSGAGMDWYDAANRAFNYYFNAIRKGEDYDTAAEWFCTEIAEQTEAANLDYEYGWQEEILPAQLRIISDTVSNRLKSLNDEQGYKVSAEFYHAFASFFSDVIYNRSQADGTNLEELQNYWNAELWSELPSEYGDGFFNSSDADAVPYGDHGDVSLGAGFVGQETQQQKGGKTMKLDLKVVYYNADSGESDEQIVSVETDNETMDFLATVCDSRPTEQTFETLFKKMYDNPTMDGAEKGILYDEIWPIMSRWAFDKLGWDDVTVDVIGLTIDGDETKLEQMIDIGMIDNRVWSLQLSPEGYMYCYS